MKTIKWLLLTLTMSAKRPTMKQRAAIKKIVENNGNISRSMREVGYSPATAKNPSALTNSAWFRKVLDSMDDSKYLDKLDEIAMDTEDKELHCRLLESY